jgi:hypothetical protein
MLEFVFNSADDETDKTSKQRLAINKLYDDDEDGSSNDAEMTTTNIERRHAHVRTHQHGASH